VKAMRATLSTTAGILLALAVVGVFLFAVGLVVTYLD
jgi:hypothetical protein